jgi:hypothetical protein
MTARLSRQLFIDHMGSVFTVLAEGDLAIQLTLVEVNDLGTREVGGATIESYALLFEGPYEPLLNQSTFQFVHPEMGELVIFIVPIGPRGGAMGYEAVFS